MHGCAAAATCGSSAATSQCKIPRTPEVAVTRKTKVNTDEVGALACLPDVPTSKQIVAWLESEVAARIVCMDKKIDILMRRLSIQERCPSKTPIFLMPPPGDTRKCLPAKGCVGLKEIAAQSDQSPDVNRLSLPEGDDGLFEEGSLIGPVSLDSTMAPKCTSNSSLDAPECRSPRPPPQQSSAANSSSDVPRPDRLSQALSHCRLSRLSSPESNASGVPEWVSEVRRSVSPPSPRGSGAILSNNSKKMKSVRTSSWTDVRGLTTQYVACVRQRKITGTQQAIWSFLEDAESSPAAAWYASLVSFCVGAAVVLDLLQIMEIPIIGDLWGVMLESVIDLFFIMELIVRVAVCPSISGFFVELHNMVDACALLSFTLRIYVTSNELGRDTVARTLLLGMVPALRLLKVLRHWLKFRLLWASFKQAFEALPILMYILVVIILVFACLIKLVEPADNIDTFWRAMWLAIITITTVGYGDYYPVSEMGYVVVGILNICAIMYMAMPLGMIGNAFKVVWDNRENIMIINRFRERAEKWGFQPVDLPQLFQMFDNDEDGVLTLEEFIDLASSMRLGMRVEEIENLFKVFDQDGGGSIDIKEFVQTIYPKHYRKIFEDVEDTRNVELNE